MITLKKDIFKLTFSRKLTIWIMIFCSLLMIMVIAGALLWMGTASYNDVGIALKKAGKPYDINVVRGYIRWRTIFTILQNFIISIFFAGLVLWSYNGRRFGIGFPLVWILLFGANAVGIFFVSPILNWSSILIGIANIFIIVSLIIFAIKVMQHKADIRQKIAKGKI